MFIYVRVTHTYSCIYKYTIQVTDIELIFIRCTYPHNTPYAQVQECLQSVHSFTCI